MSSETPEIPFIKPSFPSSAEVAAAYDEIVATNWFTNFGPQERRFARELAAVVGGGVAVATQANGTTALLAALEATVGHGDGTREVLVPSFTFVAVAQAVTWCGYRVRFVDVDPVTWQPDHVAAREALGGPGSVAAFLVPNVFGVGNPDIAAWEQLADDAGVPLVVDSAAGFGSLYADDGRVGSRGTCEIFSFHATKPFAIGEGGAVTSRDPAVVERVDAFSNFGFAGGRESTALGLNAKLQELGAAIGLAQLPGLDARLRGRQGVLARYRAALEPAGLTFQPNAERSSLCFASALCASAEQKVHVLEALRAEGVQARDYYSPPIHRQSFFARAADAPGRVDLPVTDDLCARIVSLPVHDTMDDADVERVVHAATRGHAR